jgi:hypothetical protein
MTNQLLTGFKQKLKVLTGRASNLKKEVGYAHEWYGN